MAKDQEQKVVWWGDEALKGLVCGGAFGVGVTAMMCAVHWIIFNG